MRTVRLIEWFPAVVLFTGVTLAAVLVGASPARAQGQPAPAATPATGTSGPVGVVAPPPAHPAPDFGFEPALPLEQGTRPEDYHGERTRSVYQPAFVKGAVKTTRTSRTSGIRVGLSGWTAVRIPYDDREASGGPAFGLTIEWGTPLEPPADPPVPPQR